MLTITKYLSLYLQKATAASEFSSI